MNKIAQELDQKLQGLDPIRAETLSQMVRQAIEKIDQQNLEGDWPKGYFKEILGSFPNEPLERAPQGELPVRDEW